MSDCAKSPQEKICAYEYTVRRGDSFYLIAHRLGVPLRDLLNANPDMNPARLMVGDVLCIPMEEDDAPQTPAPSPSTPPAETPPPQEDMDTPAMPEQEVPDLCPGGTLRTIQEGETAADIQLSEGLSRNTLQSANPSTNLEQLIAGETLCIPSENIPCPAASYYTLRTGETLESAALSLNVSIGALLRANPCLAPADFVPGACILLP
ncbi:MAG: LysM peptidoglycan-binding domain-containing protein [Clostridiales bacterium]|nr:LysM peptidoglycan-binding domain-containing protein [Clostridiales bacterium]